VSNKPLLLVAGLGAIGSVLYVRIDSLGIFKCISLTSERGTQLALEKGISVKLSENIAPKRYYPTVFSNLPEKLKGKISKCIVATKSYNNKILAPYLAEVLSENASILIFQNGLENEKFYVKANPKWKITRAVSSIGSNRKDGNIVEETAKGQTFIGPVNHSDQTNILLWKEILSKSGLECEISKNIQKDVWMKAIVNSCINPIGAILGIRNGKIKENEFLLKVVKGLIKEILPVAQEFVEISFEEAYKKVLEVINVTSANYCSMLQDINKGVKTEIDSINGAIIRLGQNLGLTLPLNNYLVNLIIELESKKTTREQATIELKAIQSVVKL